VNKNPLSVRDYMRLYSLTLETVSMRANCTLEEACRALDPEVFDTSPLILVAKVQGAVEQELSARGWNGEKKQLWSEFDERIKKLSAG
jgi:hypothetical protein